MSDHGRILHDGRPRWVRVREGRAVLLDDAPWERTREVGEVDAAAAEWLPPVAPSKILAVGRNHALHAREHGVEAPTQPLLFLKAPSSLLADGGDVLLPPESSRVEFEGEMAVVIGRRVRRWRPADGLAGVVLGYTVADDVTARDLQRADGQWSRGKSFDTFCPVARLVRAQPPAPDAVLRTTVNGEVRQEAPLSAMLFDVATILAHATAAMTLEPGDLVLTGTPAGVGPLSPGDRVRISVDGLPELHHGVRPEDSA